MTVTGSTPSSPLGDVLLEVHGLVRGSRGGVSRLDAQVVERGVTGHGGGDGQASLREHALKGRQHKRAGNYGRVGGFMSLHTVL